jgi:hypothetical protein
MKVICKGFKNCFFKGRCHHSKEHDFDSSDSITSCSGYEGKNGHNCYCGQKHLRHKKLEKLRNI